VNEEEEYEEEEEEDEVEEDEAVKEEDEEEVEEEEAEAEIIRACVKRKNIPLPSSSFPLRSVLPPLLALSDLSFRKRYRYSKKNYTTAKQTAKSNPYLLCCNKIVRSFIKIWRGNFFRRIQELVTPKQVRNRNPVDPISFDSYFIIFIKKDGVQFLESAPSFHASSVTLQPALVNTILLLLFSFLKSFLHLIAPVVLYQKMV